MKRFSSKGLRRSQASLPCGGVSERCLAQARRPALWGRWPPPPGVEKSPLGDGEDGMGQAHRRQGGGRNGLPPECERRARSNAWLDGITCDSPTALWPRNNGSCQCRCISHLLASLSCPIAPPHPNQSQLCPTRRNCGRSHCRVQDTLVPALNSHWPAAQGTRALRKMPPIFSIAPTHGNDSLQPRLTLGARYHPSHAESDNGCDSRDSE